MTESEMNESKAFYLPKQLVKTDRAYAAKFDNSEMQNENQRT